MTDPRSGSQRTAEEDFKMVREDGLWKIDISKYR